MDEPTPEPRLASAGPRTQQARSLSTRADRGVSDSLRWPALDGMRAIAVLAVIGLHIGILRGGYLGVDVFFVLSGFLITSLLIDEWDKRRGSISFANFYARRVLRLFPALGCVIAAAVVLALLLQANGNPVDQPYARSTLTALPWVALFASNFVMVHQANPLALGALSHTWSLAVEEQFYLLWPALFVLLMRRRPSRSRVALSLAGIAVAEMVYRIVMPHLGYGPDRVYYATDTHSDGLLIGCALAFWQVSSGATSRRPPKGLAPAASWLGASVLLILFAAGQQANAPIEIPLAVLATAAIVGGVIWDRTPARLERFLCSRWARHIGRRSYGLYLWHFVLISGAEALMAPITGLFPSASGPRILFATVIGLAATAAFVASDLSYRFVELPALRLKRRFSISGVGTAGPGRTEFSSTSGAPLRGPARRERITGRHRARLPGT